MNFGAYGLPGSGSAGKVPATKRIVNAHSAGGSTPIAISATSLNGARVLSGSQTAGVLTTLVNVSGKGWASIIACQVTDTTSRTIRLQVEIDGVVVFDATSAATTTNTAAIFAAGEAASGFFTHGHPVRFNSSLIVRCATSNTETDKLAVQYAYTLD